MIRTARGTLCTGVLAISVALLTGCGQQVQDGTAAGSGQPAPCATGHVEGMITAGEAPDADTFYSSIVVINRSLTVCTVQGFSELEWHTGGDGRPLPITTVKSDDPVEPVTIALGEQASFTMTVTMDGDGTRTDCAEGASYAYVTLPEGGGQVKAWMPDRTMGLPEVCGPIQITPWSKGSAPGVPW